MKNTLYLRKMGMNDENISTDIKNHRIRVIENIDICYNGKLYNMFFEFTQGAHRNYRTTNKRTGAPLKKAVEEIIVKDGLYIDTEYETTETTKTGFVYHPSFRCSALEREFYSLHMDYTKKNILTVVNKYKVGEKFTDVVLIEKAAADIIEKIGGYREKDILGKNKNFQVDGDSYFSIGATWNNDHKIVRCNKREWEKTDNGRKLIVTDFCEVDLVTGKITN